MFKTLLRLRLPESYLSWVSLLSAQDGLMTLKNADILTIVPAKLPKALISEARSPISHSDNDVWKVPENNIGLNNNSHED